MEAQSPLPDKIPETPKSGKYLEVLVTEDVVRNGGLNVRTKDGIPKSDERFPALQPISMLPPRVDILPPGSLVPVEEIIEIGIFPHSQTIARIRFKGRSDYYVFVEGDAKLTDASPQLSARYAEQERRQLVQEIEYEKLPKFTVANHPHITRAGLKLRTLPDVNEGHIIGSLNPGQVVYFTGNKSTDARNGPHETFQWVEVIYQPDPHVKDTVKGWVAKSHGADVYLKE